MFGLKQHKVSKLIGDMLSPNFSLKTNVHSQAKPSINYYPFGSSMVSYSNEEFHYGYGFNGMEKDDEVKGEKNHNSFGDYGYDPRIGRRWNLDPKSNMMSFETPYSFSNNMPTYGGDPNGEICLPCVIMLIGFLTAPEVAVAPTGKPEDKDAIQSAKKLKGNWVLYSVMAGGVSSGALGRTFLNELKNQFYIQAAGNTLVGFKDWKEGNKVDFVVGVLVKSFKSLDLFDASLTNLNMSKMAKTVLAATIDISPEESEALGLGKDLPKVSIDAIFSAFSEYTGGKIAKGKWGEMMKKLLSRADEVMQNEINKELKEQLGDDEFNKLMKDLEDERNTPVFLPPVTDENNSDNTRHVLPIPIN